MSIKIEEKGIKEILFFALKFEMISKLKGKKEIKSSLKSNDHLWSSQ